MKDEIQTKIRPLDWTFMVLVIVMSLALTHVGGKLFAADSVSPRKFAVIATGFYDHDSEGFRESRGKDSLNTYHTLVKSGYQVSWLFTGQTKDPQGVSGALLKTVFDWSEHVEGPQGSLRKGDQVLILVRAHGEPRRPGHQLHRVDFGDGPRMDMESLRPYLEKLHQAGIKTALIDSSCYSGNSIDLGSTGACVISSQNRFNPGRFETLEVLPGDYLQSYDFDYAFQKALASNSSTNLEEIFLAGRRNLHAALPSAGETQGLSDFFDKLHYENDLPEISSAVHYLLRPLWDRRFYLDQTKDWGQDISSLESESQIDPQIEREFEQSAKALYGFDPDTYEKYREFMEKRVTWINELSRIEAEDPAVQNSTYGARKSYIRNQLTLMESAYRKTLNRLFYNERDVYEKLYRSLSARESSSNACREFKL